MQTENNVVVCDAQENDWLDISYTQQKYVNKKEKSSKTKWMKKLFVKIAIVSVLCVAVLGAMLLIDNDFKTDVFATVKTAYSSVIDVFQKPQPVNNVINIPCNVTLVDSVDGVSTFGGGKATLSFTDGTVTNVEEGSVTVFLDDDTSIVYTNLTEVFVTVGQTVSANSLIGRYQENFCATIAEKGEVVKQVVASPGQLTWQV